jgi:hypothetical protein
MEDFLHDIWTHHIYPQLDIPVLLVWRQVNKATHQALSSQSFWRQRLLRPGKGPFQNTAVSILRGSILSLMQHFNFTQEPMLRWILNILFTCPDPTWYQQRRRALVLHSSRDRRRVHTLARVLGLYSRTILTGGVHLYKKKDHDNNFSYDSEPECAVMESIMTTFEGTNEVAVTVYWNPDQVPPYEPAPSKADRILVQGRAAYRERRRFKERTLAMMEKKK